MRSADDYSLALYPEPAVVLGRRLQPFCLGHALLLQRLGSPFAADEPRRGPMPADLLLAVIVCSKPYPAAEQLVMSPRLPRRLTRAGIRMWLCYSPARIQIELIRFGRYIEDAWRSPKVWIERSGAPRGAPPVATLKVTLMSGLGMSAIEALSMPIGAAIWDATTYSESMGGIRIRSASDEALIDAAKRMAAEAAATAE